MPKPTKNRLHFDIAAHRVARSDRRGRSPHRPRRHQNRHRAGDVPWVVSPIPTATSSTSAPCLRAPCRSTSSEPAAPNTSPRTSNDPAGDEADGDATDDVEGEVSADVHAVQADRGSGHDTANPPWPVQPRPGADDDGDRDRRVARRVSGPSRVGRIAVKEHVREVGGRPATVDDELHDVVDQIGEDPRCRRSSDQAPEDIASGQGSRTTAATISSVSPTGRSRGLTTPITAPKAPGGSLNHLNTATSAELGEPAAAMRGRHHQTHESDPDRQPWPSARYMTFIDGQRREGNSNDGAASSVGVAPHRVGCRHPRVLGDERAGDVAP